MIAKEFDFIDLGGAVERENIVVRVDSEYLFTHNFHSVFSRLMKHRWIKLQHRIAVDNCLFLEELFVPFLAVVDEV